MKGQIIKVISNDYTIKLDNNEKMICKPRGVFRNQNITPLAGDYCLVDIEKKVINEILPRKNELNRPPVSNIDIAVVVMSTIKPDFSIEAPVLLHILDAEVIYETIISELNYRQVYTESNFYKIGDLIQSNPLHDKLNISLEAYIEGSSDNRSFDSDGITLKSVKLISDAKVINNYGDNRFAYYLGVKPTGNIYNILVNNGTKTVKELMKDKYLECISFSGLQVDVFNDYIGGEVRLAKYHDGNKVIPVTGISISGKLSSVLNTIELSKEFEVKNTIKAPKLIKLDNMKIF